MSLLRVGMGVALGVALVALGRKRSPREGGQRRAAGRQGPRGGQAAAAAQERRRGPVTDLQQHDHTGEAEGDSEGMEEEEEKDHSGRPGAALGRLRQAALLLLKLALSVAAALLMHTAAGRDVPWRNVALSAAAIFVLTELGNLGKAHPAPPPQQQQQQQQQRLRVARRPPPKRSVPLHDFSGLWVKDKEASDSMEEACQLMRMNALLRTAIRLIKGLRIRQGDGQFEMSVLSGILWFKVTERYPLDGGERSFKRRDMRRGKHVGSVRPLPDGALELRVEWPDPLGGRGTDTFRCPFPGTLWVDTVLAVGGQEVRYRQVYHKQQ